MRLAYEAYSSENEVLPC